MLQALEEVLVREEAGTGQVEVFKLGRHHGDCHDRVTLCLGVPECAARQLETLQLEQAVCVLACKLSDKSLLTQAIVENNFPERGTIEDGFHIIALVDSREVFEEPGI